jgi:hypothetical protein
VVAFFQILKDIMRPNNLQHQNVDQQFIKTVRFEKNQKFAIFCLEDLAILPVLDHKMLTSNQGILYFPNEIHEKSIHQHMKEYGMLKKLQTKTFSINASLKLKECQFTQIYMLNIDFLMSNPVALLCELFRLLIDSGKLNLYLIQNEKNNFVLKRLLQEAEMGEMIGLLEKIGFSSRIFLQNIIDKDFTVQCIQATKPKQSNAYHYDFSELNQIGTVKLVETKKIKER